MGKKLLMQIWHQAVKIFIIPVLADALHKDHVNHLQAADLTPPTCCAPITHTKLKVF
jgi:hypothetical protein